MKKLVIILALLVVLATTLSACNAPGAYKTTTDNTVQTTSQTNLDDLVGNDLNANDTGNNDFIEIGEMI